MHLLLFLILHKKEHKKCLKMKNLLDMALKIY